MLLQLVLQLGVRQAAVFVLVGRRKNLAGVLLHLVQALLVLQHTLLDVRLHLLQRDGAVLGLGWVKTISEAAQKPQQSTICPNNLPIKEVQAHCWITIDVISASKKAEQQGQATKIVAA